jgi:hypothetical protein
MIITIIIWKHRLIKLRHTRNCSFKGGIIRILVEARRHRAEMENLEWFVEHCFDYPVFMIQIV